MQILSALKNRVFQTILVISLYIVFADFLSLTTQRQLYTISLLIKDLLVWIMPLTVGVFIAHTVSSFKRQALLFVLTIMIFETLPNFTCVWYAFSSANLVSQHVDSFTVPGFDSTFLPLWKLPLVRPAWWGADKGAFCGLILGCIAAVTSNFGLINTLHRGYVFMEWLLTKVFARLIPIFILGFVVKIYQIQLFNYILLHYANLVSYLILFLLLYILVLFILGSGGSWSKTISSIKNLLPAGSIALTSGCSLSTMPWTIAGTEKNLERPELAKAVIPATTNIQQVGDMIANSFLCFLIYRNFHGYNPDLVTWAQFSVIFVLARFATAAVIGGAIFIMIPIYETYLNFNAEMVAIILAFNVILDPLITSSNVVANGALCRIFEIIWTKCSTKISKY